MAVKTPGGGGEACHPDAGKIAPPKPPVRDGGGFMLTRDNPAAFIPPHA